MKLSITGNGTGGSGRKLMQTIRSLQPAIRIAAIMLFFVLPCTAQDAVQVGKGAYASEPPDTAGGKVKQIQSQTLYLVNEDDRPIPTNKWWTQLVVSKFAKGLWSYPYRCDTSEKGVDIYYPIKWDNAGDGPVHDLPLTVSGKDFTPADARTKDWSDWLVSFRMAESADKYMDVTLGEGMPCTWIEYHGVSPTITLPKGTTAVFFDRSGTTGALPASGDCFGIQYKDRQYGIFAPDGSKFTSDGSVISVEFSGPSQYLVVAALPTPKDLEYFHSYAYAVPRNTELSWKYDATKGAVTTNWKITTESLKGDQKQIIQGWIPHHYHSTTNNLAFNDVTYITARGTMKCTAGNEFSITFPYSGILPNLPAPKAIGGAHDYDQARMHTYLDDVASKPKFGADTYWGGKDILRFGQCALMSQQISDPTYKTFVDSLHGAMADWFTYTPGKADHYFTYYPRWKAMVGIKTSYGSDGFNDHHFHYGYFAFASALLAMHDPSFAADYGEMATLVVKDYANWDRTDKRFPFLRTFDAWAGHSWAGGTSAAGGENEESSSEDVQSFAGMIFLGQALGNDAMRDCGIMGYATESQAVMEYWFNQGGDVFPPAWKHPVTGMVWGGGKVFGTYFTGDPAWVYGIQWLPASPMLSYLVRDPAFARKSFQNMEDEYNGHEKSDAAKPPKPGKEPHVARTASIKTFGPALGSVMLGYVLMYDPNWVAEQLDTLWNEPGDTIAHNAGEMTVMYYQAHSMRKLGLVDWTCHGTSPTSMVYHNDTDKSRTFVVWNPTTTAQTVKFYEGDKLLGELAAPPQALTSANELSPAAH
jgi:endoglucanase Acf2